MTPALTLFSCGLSLYLSPSFLRSRPHFCSGLRRDHSFLAALSHARLNNRNALLCLASAPRQWIFAAKLGNQAGRAVSDRRKRPKEFLALAEPPLRVPFCRSKEPPNFRRNLFNAECPFSHAVIMTYSAVLSQTSR